MSDLEMTRLCAEAMGWHTGKLARKVVAYKVNDCAIIAGNDRGGESVYDPLHDDAQCFALVEKFHFEIDFSVGGEWSVRRYNVHGTFVSEGRNTDLNRAIVECVSKMHSVAKMRQAKA